MAATGSDPVGRRRGRRRLSLRLRLTLLYGACFLVGSGAVLAVTYLLVARDTSSQTKRLDVSGSKIRLPSSPLTLTAGGAGASSTSDGMMIEQIHISPNGSERITWVPSPSSRRSEAQRAARTDGLKYAACLRAHGVRDYPNPTARQALATLEVNKGGKVIVSGQTLSEPYSVVQPAINRCQKYIEATFGPRYTSAQLTKIQAGALAMSKCMRAHGLNYPDLHVGPGPGGHGIEVGAPPVSHAGLRSGRGLDSSRGAESSQFRKDNIICSRLLNETIPGNAATATSSRSASPVQRQLNVIVDKANGALTTQRSRSLRVLLTWLAAALGVLALISILLGWLVAGRALRPMRRMTSRARRITEENLHERLAADTGEDELGELATTFDGVLARLERAFDAQKRFVANASHELRTPITLERALLEIALATPHSDAESLRATCERVLASTKQQQQMIEALLTLARSQGGTDVEEPVDLAELVQDAIALRERRLDGLTVATDLHAAPLSGDPALLERLVANLLDNAINHNRTEDAWITVETGHEAASSWLRVSNSGPEIPEWMISEIFEPFRRLDGERTATATGVGLGLSIVRAIADVHGAAIDAGPVAGGGFRIEVRF